MSVGNESNTLDLIAPPIRPPTLDPRGSPYYHEEPHCYNANGDCTMCWKYWCVGCGRGTNRHIHMYADCWWCGMERIKLPAQHE